MKRALLTFAAAMLMSGSAFAADVIAPEPGFDWTGFYVGGNIGYAWGDSEADGLYDGGDIENGDFDPDGVIAGGQLGYNWQTDSNFVIGLEADLQWSDQHDRVDNPPGFDSEATADVDVNWFGTLRARAGIAVMDTLLLYATGGLAAGEVEYSVDDAGGVGSDSNSQWGWTAGAGAEWALSDRFTLKAEYLHVDLGKDDFSPTGSSSFDADVDTDFDVVRGGINILFH
jgi:outer membrane immunogenic protein